MTAPAFDREKSQAFAGRIFSLINNTALATMINIGGQTGLFDVMSGQPPANSETIAQKAGLAERYVREWLGGMVVGQVITYDPTRKTYALPPEHAAWLGSSATMVDYTGAFDFVYTLGAMRDAILQCFQNGGGIPYSQYVQLMDVMAAGNRHTRDELIAVQRLDLVPGLTEKLASGIAVADIGCGNGHILNLMAQAYPRSRFTGYDFMPENIAAGTAEAAAMGLSNIQFEQQDAATLDRADTFDFILAVDAIHDQAKPAVVLENIARALKADGVFLMVEINASSHLENNVDHPMGPFLYLASLMHCTPVSLAHDGPGLGAMWGQELATQMLQDAGFKRVEAKLPEGATINLYYIARK